MKDAIGFHRARTQSALAGGTRARNRLAQEARPGVILQPEAVGLQLLRGRRTLEHESEHEHEGCDWFSSCSCSVRPGGRYSCS
jgi:hypothetical protein